MSLFCLGMEVLGDTKKTYSSLGLSVVYVVVVLSDPRLGRHFKPWVHIVVMQRPVDNERVSERDHDQREVGL